jgi:hypothetical protein
MRSILVAVVFVAVVGVTSASICSNPTAYVGQSLCDPWGTYCGECVSFVKVCTGMYGLSNTVHLNIYTYVTHA